MRFLSARTDEGTSPSGGGRAWRAISTAILTVLGSVFVAEIIARPTKRNIEALIGIIFIGLGIQAPVITLCAFAILLLPYPMFTSVGSTSTLMVLAVGALTLARSREIPGHPVPRDRTAHLWLGAFLLMVVISLYKVPGVYYEAAYQRYIGLTAAIAIYFLVIHLVRSISHLELLLKAFMFSAVTVGTISTLQTLFPHRTWLPPIFRFSEIMSDLDSAARGEIRVFASLNGISPFAEFVATSVVIMFVLARRTRNLYERAFWIVGILLLLTGLAGSATRMGIITLGFGFVLMLFIGPRAIPRWQIGNVLFIAFALFVLSYAFISPLTENMEARLSSLGADDSSAQSRWGVMVQALEAIPDNPLLGHGIFTPPKTFRGGVGANIHCLYLTLPYMFGIPALVFFLMYAGRIVLGGLRRINDQRIPPELREYQLALVTAAIMTFFYELTGEFITHSQHSQFFWLRLGLLAASTGLCQSYMERPQGDAA